MNRYYKLERLFDELTFNIKLIILNDDNEDNYKKANKNFLKILKTTSKLTGINQENINIVESFDGGLGNIIQSLKADLVFAYESDPAAFDLKEIVLTYPGYHAIVVYRIAHLLFDLKINYLPRMLSEYAHSLTGIDIHPGAKIGNYFFIDHGTGIVIGETAHIGHCVKIYQGVTIGALSLGRGQKLKGTKRHPTIGNNVTIYAGASILGGETIIGDNVIIGSNAYILESIDSNSVIKIKEVDLEIKNKKIKKDFD